MSTETTADAAIENPVADHTVHDGHKPDSYYVKVALTLALITGLEVALSYADVGAFFIPALLLMMAAKFVAVVSIFMHLKFDNRIFSWMFYTGLFLAIGVYVAALTAFQFFGK